MTEQLPPRTRKVKILATLGPASDDPETIRKLMFAGADAFRINMSHGSQDQKAALVERELDVRAVLLGQRGDRQKHVGDVDALVVGQPPADLDLGLDPVVIGADDLEPHLAVVDEDMGAGLHALEQLGMGKLDPLSAAGRRIPIEDEAVALVEHRLAALEVAHPELGALKVEDDCRRTPEFLLQRADHLDQPRFLPAVAVTHVDAEGVRAREHQLADHPGLARGGPERGEDLHLARPRRESLGHKTASLRWEAPPIAG